MEEDEEEIQVETLLTLELTRTEARNALILLFDPYFAIFVFYFLSGQSAYASTLAPVLFTRAYKPRETSFK